MKAIYWIVFAALFIAGIHDVMGQAPHPSVLINWTYPATATGITFNVYRRTCPCAATDPWTKLNTAGPIAVKTYTDAAVLMGKTYDYGIAATDGTVESTKTVATATLPVDGVSGVTVTPQ